MIPPPAPTKLLMRASDISLIFFHLPSLDPIEEMEEKKLKRDGDRIQLRRMGESCCAIEFIRQSAAKYFENFLQKKIIINFD